VYSVTVPLLFTVGFGRFFSWPY